MRGRWVSRVATKVGVLRRIYREEDLCSMALEILSYATRPIRRVYVFIKWYCLAHPSSRDFIQKVIHGNKMLLRSTDIGISRELAVYGVHEPVCTRMLLETSKTGMTVIDIGSNIGYYVLLESAKVGEKGKVIAVEPEKANFELLGKNVELNQCGNVQLYHLAISDVNSYVDLNISQRSNWHSLMSVGEPSGEVQTVRAMTLDAFVDDVGLLSVDLVRMDIEGFEYRVISGMTKVLRQHAPILLIEIHPRLAGPQNIAELLLYLHSEGYDTLWLVDRIRDVPWFSRCMKVQCIPLPVLAQDERIWREQRALAICLGKNLGGLCRVM